jgi:hypothetical protein
MAQRVQLFFQRAGGRLRLAGQFAQFALHSQGQDQFTQTRHAAGGGGQQV